MLDQINRNRNLNSPWANQEHVDLLKQWWGEGLSCTMIVGRFAAMGLAITKNSIIGKVHRLGLQRRKNTPHIVSPRSKPINPRAKKEPYSNKVIRPKYIHGDVVMTSIPNPVRRVLFREIRDGQCKAIVGYLNGVIADAVCCGEDAPHIIRNGRIAHSSWCPHHHEIYTIRGRYESGARTSR